MYSSVAPIWGMHTCWDTKLVGMSISLKMTFSGPSPVRAARAAASLQKGNLERSGKYDHLQDKWAVWPFSSPQWGFFEPEHPTEFLGIYGRVACGVHILLSTSGVLRFWRSTFWLDTCSLKYIWRGCCFFLHFLEWKCTSP